MVVVAIVGVLATLATVGYRRYIASSKVSEAIYMVGSIRAAEESYRAETLQYLTTNWPDLYPMAKPTKVKYAWDTGTAAATPWKQLGVQPDGPVYFGYKVQAGAPGGTPLPPDTATKPKWPEQTTEPWYVVEAVGDLDGDGVTFSYVVGSSFTGDLYIENQGE
jgi:type IV pilus assembly protein PilA